MRVPLRELHVYRVEEWTQPVRNVLALDDRLAARRRLIIEPKRQSNYYNPGDWRRLALSAGWELHVPQPGPFLEG